MEKNFSCNTKHADIKRAFRVRVLKEDMGYNVIEVSERRVYPGKYLSKPFKDLKHMTCDEFIWRYPILPEKEQDIEELFQQVCAGLSADPDLDLSLITNTPATHIRISLPERDRPSKSPLKKIFDTDHPVTVIINQNGEDGELSFMFDKLDPKSRTRIEDTYNLMFNRGDVPLEKSIGSYAGNLIWCLDKLKKEELATCYPTLATETELELE